MRTVTLVFIVKGSQVLLGLKKVRFGAGHVNGFGGKVEEGESIETAAVREVKEEVGLTVPIESLRKVALMHFRFTDHPEFAHDVHTFVTSEFSGEPSETEEMKPEWHNLQNLPLTQMWPADHHWIPLILQQGKQIEGKCVFAGKERPFTVASFSYTETTF